MVRIKLVNFKTYADSEFEIKDSAVTLISGPSGAGKSTLFAAIEWCLYGNLRGIASDMAPKSRTSVTLWFEHSGRAVTVYRQRNPVQFKVVLSSKDKKTEFSDAAAQAEIEKIFGPEVVWRATSYVAQKEYNWFFHASRAERKEFLSTITFGKDDPAEIESVLNKLAKTKSELQTENVKLTALFEKELEDYTKRLENDEYLEITAEELAAKKKRLSVVVRSVKEARTRVNQYHKNLGTKESLEARINSIESDLAKAPDALSSDYIESLRAEELSIRNAVKVLAERQALEAELAGHLEMIEKTAGADDVDFSEVNALRTESCGITEQLRKYKHYFDVCQSLGIEYTEEAIEAEKTRLSEFLAAQPRRVAAQKWTKQQEKVLELECAEPEDSAPYRKRLDDLTRSLNVLSCPHCQGGVRYQSGKLIKSDIVKSSNHDVEAAELRKKCTELDAEAKKYAEYCAAWNVLENLDSDFTEEDAATPPASPYEVTNATNTLKKLSNVSYVPKPQRTASELTAMINRALAKHELAKVQAKIDNLPAVDPEVRTERLAEIKKILTQNTDTAARRKVLNEQLLSCRKQLKELALDSESETELGSLETEQAELESEIKQGTAYLEITATHDKLEQMRAKLDELYEDSLDYAKLTATANDLEAETLAVVTDSINRCLETIVPQILGDEITLALDTIKNTKDGRSKPEVNLKIFRNGVAVEIRDLSGGERDRVSFALTLSLNILMESKFLMLDETFSSVGNALEMTSVEIIKELCPHTTSMCIVHDGIEGAYDDHLTISKDA